MAISARLPRFVMSLAVAMLAAASSSYAAVPAALITRPINNQQRVTLHGNVRPRPAHASDLGAVPANMPAQRVQLLLRRPAASEAALTQFLADVQTPGSAMYHKWMTPAQFGNEFGPNPSDVQAVVAWLQSQGFAVTRVSPARTSIEFSGTAGQIERAFSTQIHSFQVGTETHVSNITDPQIPAALAPVVAGLSPLNNFRLKPMHSAPWPRLAESAPTSANPRAMSVRSVASSAAGVQPELTVPNSNGTESFYVTPGDLATIYNIPNQALNSKATTTLDGSGVSIGIAGVSNVNLTDVARYRALFGLAGITPTVTVDGNDPGIDGDNSVEALLDLEQVSAVAPNAATTLYIAQDTTFQQGLFLAIQRALDDNTVSILNVSFGGCEAFQTQAGNQEVLNFWQQAAAQGISVTVSTGDSDASTCDSADATAAAQGLQVNALASTPYNIAVGGTDFNQTPANASQFWSTTNNTIFASALGPIPEIPWNNATTTVGGLASNVATRDSSGNTRIDGAGGGISGCLNASLDNNGNIVSCSGAYAQPGFQSGFGSGGARELPDVSLFAANGGHQAAYLLCASGLGGDAPTDQDCLPNPSDGKFGFQAVGGTSASSPVFAGMLALVSQSLGGARLGQADVTLYPLSRQNPAAFHDVTTGNNSPVCFAGTPNCGANGFLTGYDATPGYDMASGLGSVNVTQMVQSWNAVTFKGTTTTLALNGSTTPLTITHGSAVPVSITVSGSGGTPVGNAVLINNSSAVVAAVQSTTPSPSVFTLANGTASGNYAFLPGGSYTVRANYQGDGTFGASMSNPINVTVTPEASTLDLVVQDFPASGNGAGSSANGATNIPYGSYISVAAQPISTAQLNSKNPVALASGVVIFNSTASLLNQTDPINSNGFAEIANQVNLAYPPGTYSVSASYPGDPSFSASSAPAQTFTVTKADTFSSLAAFPASGSGSFTVEVDPNNQQFFTAGGALVPSGTVNITNSSGTTIGTGTLKQVTFSDGSSTAQATVSVPQGSTNIGISYSGDGNYNAPTGINCALGQLALCLPAGNFAVARSSSASALISITPQSGFSGTVNVSCSVGKGSGTTPTCSLSQPSFTVNGGPAVDVLTVSASSTASLHLPDLPARRPWYAAGGATLAGLLLLGLPRRRRAWQSMLSLLVIVFAIGFAGCGGGSSSNNGGGGSGGGGNTSSGTYVVTVTATSGTASVSNTLTVAVK